MIPVLCFAMSRVCFFVCVLFLVVVTASADDNASHEAMPLFSSIDDDVNDVELISMSESLSRDVLPVVDGVHDFKIASKKECEDPVKAGTTPCIVSIIRNVFLSYYFYIN